MGRVSAMGSRFTRRRFLEGMGVGVTYLALANTVGCESPEHTPKVSPLTGVSSAPEEGVWTFHSRTDLSPPAVEVTEQAHDDTASGYIFVAPEEGGTAQGGSMIFDDRGQVVWFRPLQAAYGRAMNFEVQTYRGRPVLTWMESPGEYVSEFVICEDSYREIARFAAVNGYDGDHHEFLISPQDTALIAIFNAVPQDLTSVGGTKDSVAWSGKASSRSWTSRPERFSSNGKASTTCTWRRLTPRCCRMAAPDWTTSTSTP